MAIDQQTMSDLSGRHRGSPASRPAGSHHHHWRRRRKRRLFAVVGLVALFAIRNDDTATRLMRGGVVGAAALLLLAPNYTALRLELPFVPLAAYGLALLLHTIWSRAPRGPVPVPGRKLVRRGRGAAA